MFQRLYIILSILRIPIFFITATRGSEINTEINQMSCGDHVAHFNSNLEHEELHCADCSAECKVYEPVAQRHSESSGDCHPNPPKLFCLPIDVAFQYHIYWWCFFLDIPRSQRDENQWFEQVFFFFFGGGVSLFQIFKTLKIWWSLYSKGTLYIFPSWIQIFNHNHLCMLQVTRTFPFKS